jgi:hypothetical protein
MALSSKEISPMNSSQGPRSSLRGLFVSWGCNNSVAEASPCIRERYRDAGHGDALPTVVLPEKGIGMPGMGMPFLRWCCQRRV